MSKMSTDDTLNERKDDSTNESRRRFLKTGGMLTTAALLTPAIGNTVFAHESSGDGPGSGVGFAVPAQNSTIVLVHAAWADGSCWDNVILPLERHGLKVMCAPIPMTTLTDDVAALSRALERTTGPVVLVGHAYSGGVVGATRDERVKSFVYIAALAPDEGETVAKVFYRDEKHPESPKLAPDQHGFIWMPDDGFARAVAHKASPDRTRIMAAIQRPLSIHCIQEPVPAPEWKSKPSWYLVAEEDRMINPKTQHFMASRMGATVRSLKVDHSPMISAPQTAIDIIVEAARATPRP
jgi:pimeloyl-ACP methyl ester carboxylesterase